MSSQTILESRARLRLWLNSGLLRTAAAALAALLLAAACTSGGGNETTSTTAPAPTTTAAVPTTTTSEPPLDPSDGLYLVLVSNFAVASDDAIFGLPEERFGSAGTTWIYPFLAAQCGLKKANELVMTGRKFDAAEAGAGDPPPAADLSRCFGDCP